MKTQKTMLLLIVFTMMSLFSNAQPGFPGGGGGKAKLISGDLKFLKGQASLTVKFSYENMMVGEMTEEAYITKKTGEQNSAKPGSGDTWLSKWKADRTERFEPEFLSGFNKGIKKLGIVGVVDANAAPTAYTMIIKTLKTEPGFYTGVSFVEKDTYIDIKAVFVDSADPNKELATVEIKKIIGSAISYAQYDTGLKLANAYSNAGKNVGMFILKNCK